MNIAEAISILDQQASNPSQGLPMPLFEYISRTTPMVNVDLLIKDEKGRTLLAWRDDPYCGKGWHIPGGIIRFKETFEQRVQKVAQTEIGIDSIKFDSTPIDLNQIIIPHYQIRGHFISILYKCFLSGTFRPHNNGLRHDQPGFLSWHDGCPENLIPYHSIYRKYLT